MGQSQFTMKKKDFFHRGVLPGPSAQIRLLKKSALMIFFLKEI